MSVSYDIFDLADFPIIVTDKDFIIKHKNSVAARFFPKFRKGSKIMRHASDIGKNTDISSLCEIDFQTGMQLKRALVFTHNSGDVFFAFLPRFQLEDGKKLIDRLKEVYDGNFLDFYISAYNDYKRLRAASVFESSSNEPARLGEDLLLLLHTSFDKPAFMKKEVYDLAELISAISHRTGSSLRALGLKIPAANISEEARKFCFAKINLQDFSFIIFRMIYAGFKYSCDGCINISLEYENQNIARINISANTSLSDDANGGSNKLELDGKMSELSFEFELLQKTELLNNTVSYNVKDSILNIYFTVKCIDSTDVLSLRSCPMNIYNQKLLRNISENISKLKKLLSKLNM